MKHGMDFSKMPVVILCGGEGTRMREFTDVLPKPLVPLAGKPILWHIMRHYGNHGFRRFFLALGYKGDMVKEAFIEARWRGNDLRLDMASGRIEELGPVDRPDWEVTFVDTGLKTNTGGRIKRMQSYLGDSAFMVTYGDGLCDVPLDRLWNHHMKQGKMATLTGVIPFSTFGLLRFTRDNVITEFREKPRLDSWINGGYFVFEPEIFKVLGPNDVLEEKPLRTLAQDKQISIFKHDGFWRCMDTYKDWQALNELASAGGLSWLEKK